MTYVHQVPRNLTERVTDYIVSKWTNTKGVEQDKVEVVMKIVGAGVKIPKWWNKTR